jgi:hypothetical protein
MDWIERIFNVSPDQGSGLTEVLFSIALLTGLCGYAYVRFKKRKRKDDRTV